MKLTPIILITSLFLTMAIDSDILIKTLIKLRVHPDTESTQMIAKVVFPTLRVFWPATIHNVEMV